MDRRATTLLWLDGGGGAVVGIATLALHRWLAELYRLPVDVVLVIGCANLLYAAWSSPLAWRASAGRPVPRWRVDVLVAANLMWTAISAVMIVRHASHASVFGLGHFAAEGAYCAWLAWQERRHVRPQTR